MYPSITLTMSACCLTVWAKSGMGGSVLRIRPAEDWQCGKRGGFRIGRGSPGTRNDTPAQLVTLRCLLLQPNETACLMNNEQVERANCKQAVIASSLFSWQAIRLHGSMAEPVLQGDVERLNARCPSMDECQFSLCGE